MLRGVFLPLTKHLVQPLDIKPCAPLNKLHPNTPKAMIMYCIAYYKHSMSTYKYPIVHSMYPRGYMYCRLRTKALKDSTVLLVS